jgi:hypothetical protein
MFARNALLLPLELDAEDVRSFFLRLHFFDWGFEQSEQGTWT